MPSPLALPIHPLIIHFAIAMLTAAWVCVIARHSTGDPRWDGRSRLFEIVGVVALPPTIVAAFIDTRGFGFVIHPRTDAPLIWHMTTGLVASAAFATHFVWRYRRSAPGSPASSPAGFAARDIGLTTFGMIALVASGILGATMVYGA